MEKHVSLIDDSTHNRDGLAPVVCYDPWFARSLESIKQSISDGNPVLIRLHSGASYPIQPSLRYQIDLESHAVLVVGFDDGRKALEIIDPWNNQWGGELGGKRWLSYQEAEEQTVDCSMGVSMAISSLKVCPNFKWDTANNLSLELRVGFYIPRGTVMDKDSWAIKKLQVSCQLFPSPVERIDYSEEGNWIVGEMADIIIPLTSNPSIESTLKLNIEASIYGTRPYEFSDVISTSRELSIEKSSKAKHIKPIHFLKMA